MLINQVSRKLLAGVLGAGIWLLIGTSTLSYATIASAAGSQQEIAAETIATDLLSAKLSKLQTFTAEFVQFIVDKSGATVQQTNGVLRAKRPGQFYWHTAAPLEQYVKSTNEEVWVYDPDLEQVTVHKLDANVSATPAILLSGDIGKLDESYQVEYSKADQVESFTLKPRGEDSLFESLKLRFIDETLVEMRLTDGLGQRSTLSFSNVEVNTALTEADFELSLPEGIDVIRE